MWSERDPWTYWKSLFFYWIIPGKTKRSQQKGADFPNTFHVTQNEKHWANETTVLQFLDHIIIPYVKDIRGSLAAPDQRALLIFDVFRGHMTAKVKEKLNINNIGFVLVPPNLTNLFQPLDVSVNKASKTVIKNCYSKFYRDEVTRQLTAGVNPHDVKVDVRISILKPLHAKWILEVYNRFQSSRGKNVIINGFRKSHILEVLSMETFPEQDPFKSSWKQHLYFYLIFYLFLKCCFIFSTFYQSIVK